MPNFSFNVDDYLSVEDFIYACSNKDRDEIIDMLISEGNLREDCRVDDYEVYSPSESVYQEALKKLNGKWNMLTKEEEELILKIASRF